MSQRLTSNHFPKWIDVSWVKQQTHNLTQMNSGLQWSRKQNSVEWNLLTCRSEILQTVSLKYKNDTVEVGAYPISHRARDKAHPGQVSMERQPYMLTFTLMAPVRVTALGTHTSTGRMCILVDLNVGPSCCEAPVLQHCPSHFKAFLIYTII